MRHTGTQREVAEAFFSGRTEYMTGSQMYLDGDRLAASSSKSAYVYALRMPKEKMPFADPNKVHYIVNGDRNRRVMSTSGQWACIGIANKEKIAQVSFQALEAAGVPLMREGVVIVDCTLSENMDSPYMTKEKFESPEMQVAVDMAEIWYKANGYTVSIGKDEIRAHKIGGAIVRDNQTGFDYVCWMSGRGRYFVCKLPCRVATVQEGIDCLKPQAVKSYEMSTGKKAQRQGEWYFLPTGHSLDASGVKAFGLRVKDFKSYTLPRAEGGNHHMTVSGIFSPQTQHLLTGNVWHRGNRREGWGRTVSFGVTGQHSTMKLGKALHVAIENTALGSWESAGEGWSVD